MSTRLATFWAGGLLLGLDVTAVQEVLGPLVITPVPLAPPGVLGLLNLRGQLVTAIDARHRLGLSPRGSDDSFVNFIIRTEDEVVSLVADRAGDVVDVDAEAYEAVPELVSEAIRSMTTGAYKLDGALLLVLDAERTVLAAAS